MKNENYFSVQGWMVNEMKLKGNHLMCFAIIYGFTQGGEGRFNGSIKYLTECTHAGRSTIIRVLKDLTELGYLKKTETIIKNVKFCEYSAIYMGGVKMEHGWCQNETGGGVKMKPNNILNNITKEREENPAQKNPQTETDNNLNILKDPLEQTDIAAEPIRAIDFLKQNYPTRYEQQFKMRFYKLIKDQKEFVDSFNDKVDIEELPYKSNVLFARLNSYANNWVKNKDKFTPKNKNTKNGML